MVERPHRVLVCLSGGLDSCVLLAINQNRAVKDIPEKFVKQEEGKPKQYIYMKNPNLEVEAITFNYGSKHGSFEQKAAHKIVKYYDLQGHLIDLHSAFVSIQSALLIKDPRKIPEAHYKDETISQTVVPGRNMIFLSVLTGIAMSQGFDEIQMAMHAGDHAIYPDCCPGFVMAMAVAVKEATDDRVRLHVPFIHLSKKQVIEIGLEFEAPFHLTRSCYQNSPVACGKCSTCHERLEAFEALGLNDPIEYAPE